MPSNFMWRAAPILFIAACGMCCLVLSVAQNSAPPHPTPSGFKVAGTVTNAVSGHALARARVFLSNAKNLQERHATTTTEEGHFEFDNVAEGKYVLEAAKAGYITESYKQHEEFSTAVVTGTGVDSENLTFQLVPAAILSVKVLDESGEPVRRASVMLFREDHRSGERQIITASSGTTDDVGVYEFARLNAGTYFVSVMATPWYAIHPVLNSLDRQANAAADLHAFDVTYPLTFYGDTTDSDAALPLPLQKGEHAQAEIHLSPVPALHLLFHVPQNGNGFAIPSLQKSVFGNEQFQQNILAQQVSPGLFEITGAALGRYKLRLPGVAPTDADITSNGQDLSEVKPEAVGNLNATVRILGGGKLPQTLGLRPQGGDNRNLQVQGLNEKGEVTFAEVNPGVYEVVAFDRDKRYSVVNVSSPDVPQGTDTSGHALNISPGSSLTASITVVEGSANVEGFAKKAGTGFAGAMIVLVPKNPESNRELFRRDQSDLDGSFSLIGVPAGSYTVVAIENGWDLDWAVPSVIERFLPRGEPVTVGNAAGSVSRSVRLPESVEVQGR